MSLAWLKVHIHQTRFVILECDVREESIDRLPTVESECIARLSNVLSFSLAVDYIRGDFTLLCIWGFVTVIT